MSRYLVNEIFYTLQGEGAHAGRPAVFLRFALCNLWTGREKDRARAVCRFCDTDFTTANLRFDDPDDLARTVKQYWPKPLRGTPMVVCTGGEPLLQLDTALIQSMHRRGLSVHVETNGTQPIPPGLSWVCVSPKAGAPLMATAGDELKLVYPQDGVDPADYLDLDFQRFSLQPMDGPDLAANTAAAVAYCLANPDWHLSLQTHKHLGIR